MTNRVRQMNSENRTFWMNVHTQLQNFPQSLINSDFMNKSKQTHKITLMGGGNFRSAHTDQQRDRCESQLNQRNQVPVNMNVKVSSCSAGIVGVIVIV